MRTSASQIALAAEAPGVTRVGSSLSLRNPRSQLRKPLRILLVEDDEADLYLANRALATIPRVGEVIVARDGIEALDRFDRWSRVAPDLAIVDLRMPRMDGIALLRDFASRPYLRFPTLVLSSSKADSDEVRAKKVGALEFMTKPDSLEKLRRSLAAVISRLPQ